MHGGSQNVRQGSAKSCPKEAVWDTLPRSGGSMPISAHPPGTGQNGSANDHLCAFSTNVKDACQSVFYGQPSGILLRSLMGATRFASVTLPPTS